MRFKEVAHSSCRARNSAGMPAGLPVLEHRTTAELWSATGASTLGTACSDPGPLQEMTQLKGGSGGGRGTHTSLTTSIHVEHNQYSTFPPQMQQIQQYPPCWNEADDWG